MKRLFLFVVTFLLVPVFSNQTLAKPIDIEVTQGISVSLEKYLTPSDLSESIYVTGNWGLNDQLLLKCRYETESKENLIGGRFAFNENLAVMLDYIWKGSNNSLNYGIAYKINKSDNLDLVGVLEYGETAMALTGQAEYKFGDPLIGNIGLEYSMPDQGDAVILILAGAEYQPVDKFGLYFDYMLPDQGGSRIYCGVEYGF